MNPLFFILKARNFILTKKSKKFPYASIGVGGISMGGSGKTPLVIEIIEYSKKNKINCALLTRGYKRKDKTKKIIFENEKTSPFEIGDEPYLIYRKLNIPIGIDKDMTESAKEIIKHKKNVVFILDDAMQIKKFYFDLNIFILTEKEIFEREKFFPEGLARDFRKEILNANAVIINRKMKKFKKYKIEFLEKRKLPYFFAYYKLSGFFNQKGEKIELSKRDYLLLVTGIANPSSLKGFLSKNFILKEHIKFLDHHFYKENDMRKILHLKERLKCDYVVTTEKDIVRMPFTYDFIIYPKIKMEIEENFYKEILSCFIKKVKTEDKG